MDEIKTVCIVCGGTEYTLESGFYFCNDCHTQTQELREEVHVLNETFDPAAYKKTKVLKQNKTDKPREELFTTYEYYNYILLGLVEETIKLGAKKSLKRTVLQLWTAYLSKLEVAFTSKHFQNLPALSASYKNIDAEIVYNYSKKKKRRRVKNKLETTSNDQYSQKSVSIKLKQASLKSEIESVKSSSAVTTSHSMTTLSSLKSSSYTKSETKSKSLRFSKAARKELLNGMTKRHYKKYCEDPKITSYKLMTHSYQKTPFHLTKIKILSILYLGLLIDKQEIQLGDLIRWCREGHLSYNNFRSLLPENIAINDDNYKIITRGLNNQPTHKSVRQITAQIARLIGVTRIDIPDIINLCDRYVRELQLPKQIFNFIKFVYDKYPPVMKFFSKSTLIPNYEGRAMGYIIFAMKIFFRLDDVIENIASKFAAKLNHSEIEPIPTHSDDKKYLDEIDTSETSSYFQWSKWVKYIECRKLLVSEKHYPTNYHYNEKSIGNVNALYEFWKLQNSKNDYEEENAHNFKNKLYKDIFLKRISNSNGLYEFEATFTPLYTYTNTIISRESSVPSLILYQNFTDSDICYLIECEYYMKNLKNYYLDIKYSNCSMQTSIVDFFHYNRGILQENKKDINVTIIKTKKRKFIYDDEEEINKPKKRRLSRKVSKINEEAENILRRELKMKCLNSSQSDKELNDELLSDSDSEIPCGQAESPKKEVFNKRYEFLTNSKINDDSEKNTEECKTFKIPHTFYWFRHLSEMTHLTSQVYEEIEKEMPKSAAWLIKECSNVIESTPMCVYTELMFIEVQLGILQNSKMEMLEKLYPKKFKDLLKRIRTHWW